MVPSFINKSKIPHKPGIYIYKDQAGKILYVGKAIDLYHRVASYFRGKEESSSAYFNNNPKCQKTWNLVEKIKDIETIIVESELEALILEANLIKKYLPPYNIKLTDDKDYLYIGITKEDFPKVITARKQDLKNLKKYFGPYPSSTTVKTTLKRLRRVFPWCSNPPKLIKKDKSFKACFYLHIKLCPGACIGLIDQSSYLEIINRFSKFLDGKKGELLDELNQKMLKKSNQQKFEEAANIKKIISGIEYLTQPNRVSQYLKNPNFLEDERQLGLEALKNDLKLEKLPERIEGYDISNFSGKQSTGSMVVLTQGEIDKSQYRKFKIIITGKPNDVGMHKEMMGRRLKNKDWPNPNLMIIDGGRGQVRAAYEQLQANNLNIPVFGLAKKMEWLYPPEGKIIKLPKRSLSLKLLQRLRDESHRFAITYHRKLRQKEFGLK